MKVLRQMYTVNFGNRPTSQHRLLKTFNSEKGMMQMAFLQAQVPFPKAPSNYKKTIFYFDANQIHPIDQMDMHR